jgi:hypothetical protein
MEPPFDADAIASKGWRQGAVLGDTLAERARAAAPDELDFHDDDLIIIVSHDCDIVNFSLEKEPVVEVIRAVLLDRETVDKQQVGGRNPRSVQFSAVIDDQESVVRCSIHDRWNLPRGFLCAESPRVLLPAKPCRMLAEWLAKRYIRAAFPSAFDSRWRGEKSKNLKKWMKLLECHSSWMRGVYLRLNTLEELKEADVYRCHMIVAVPADVKNDDDWPKAKETIETEIENFWGQFKPGIHFDGVEVLGTDDLTLSEIEPYQRFDADWVSFADDTEVTPLTSDIKT